MTFQFAPKEFTSRLIVPLKRDTASVALSAKLPNIGQRNSWLASMAGFMRRKGHSPADLEAALLTANSQFPSPLDTNEVVRIADSIGRYDPAIDLTERALSDHLAESLCSNFKFSPALGWMHYQDGHWERDKSQMHVQEAVKDFVRGVAERVSNSGARDSREAEALENAARRLQQKRLIRDIMDLARSSPLVLDEGPWPDVPWLLNFKNGTLELRSMTLREHQAADRLTTVLPFDFDPGAECPLFNKTLADALQPELAAFVLRMFGFALTGEGGLQKMLLLVGSGRNGKSTLLEAVRHAMGPYAASADPSSFMKATYQPAINNDIAALKGARLVTTAELNAGQTLNSSLIKRMTGGEQIVARKLYEDFEAFPFDGLIVMATNFPPVFDGSDLAISRRFAVVNFDRTLAEGEVDQDLPRKLRSEAPGIINRLLEGLVDFQRLKGAAAPQVVVEGTTALVRSSNQVQEFLDTHCLSGPAYKAPAGELFSCYCVWATHCGYKPMSMPSFKRGMERTLGHEAVRERSGMMWHGVRLRTPAEISIHGD